MKSNTLKKYLVKPYFEVHEEVTAGYKSLYAAQDLKVGTILSEFNGKVFENPTRYTVQINKNQHLELQPEHLRYTNHSCEPNVFFDTTNRQLISLRSINAGEELSFFYPSTEWDMTEAFDCSCGKTQCLGRIQGANYLAFHQLRKYRLTSHIIKNYSDLGTRRE